MNKYPSLARIRKFNSDFKDAEKLKPSDRLVFIGSKIDRALTEFEANFWRGKLKEVKSKLAKVLDTGRTFSFGSGGSGRK